MKKVLERKSQIRNNERAQRFNAGLRKGFMALFYVILSPRFSLFVRILAACRAGCFSFLFSVPFPRSVLSVCSAVCSQQPSAFSCIRCLPGDGSNPGKKEPLMLPREAVFSASAEKYVTRENQFQRWLPPPRPRPVQAITGALERSPGSFLTALVSLPSKRFCFIRDRGRR